MSEKIVENLLEQIKGLAVSERNKFSSYKSRNLRHQLSEAEAVINAAARMGIFPTIELQEPAVLEAVGEASGLSGKLLYLPVSAIPQTIDIPSSNTPPTVSNIAPTVSKLECDEPNGEGGAKDNVPTASKIAPTQPAKVEEKTSTDFNWTQIAKAAGYGTVFFICTSALVYLSAEAAGGDAWSYFWAILCEGGGIACLIHPARGWNKAGLWAIGILCIFLGFSTMLTSVFKKSDSDLTKTVSTDANVKDLEEQIEQSKKIVADAERLRDDLPVTWVSKKREAQKSIDEKSRDLADLYASVKAAREAVSQNTNADIIGLWTGIEGVRRFILLLFSIVVGHAFFRSSALIAPKRLLV